MFNFNFGNKKPSIFKYAIVGIILTSVIGGLSQCTGVNENFYWDLLDEIQRSPAAEKIGAGAMLNDFFIQDPKRLQRRIHRDVDRAIANYEDEERKHRVINMKNQDILNESRKLKYSDNQRIILENAVYYEFSDGTMGIRGSWVTPDHREIELK